MTSTANLLTQTADRFNNALAIAYRQHPPPCLLEVRSQKYHKGITSEVRSEEKLLTFDLPLLTCSACPLNLSADTCPHRYQLKKAIASAIALN